MAAKPVTSSRQQDEEEEQQIEEREQKQPRLPNSVVVIVVPHDGHELPASSALRRTRDALLCPAPWQRVRRASAQRASVAPPGAVAARPPGAAPAPLLRPDRASAQRRGRASAALPPSTGRTRLARRQATVAPPGAAPVPPLHVHVANGWVDNGRFMRAQLPVCNFIEFNGNGNQGMVNFMQWQ